MTQDRSISFREVRAAIATNIRRSLKRQHLSIRKLATRSGMSRPAVSHLLGGSMSRIDLRVVTAVATALDVSPMDLMTRELAQDTGELPPLRADVLVLDD
jgi:transcriptional regulator with XRE-family HTH domain